MASSAAIRPVAYPVTFTARIDAELRAAITDAAIREGTSDSDWVRRTLAAIVPSPASTGGRPAPRAMAHGQGMAR